MGPIAIRTRKWRAAPARVRRAAETAALVLRSNHQGDFDPGSGEHWVTWSEENGRVISLAVWQLWGEKLFIGTAWTYSTKRRQGHYRHIVEALVRISRRRKLTTLAAGLHPKNRASLKAHMGSGFVQEAIYVERRIGERDAR